MSNAHLFCPNSGALLQVNGDRGVVECVSSGYAKSIAGSAAVDVCKCWCRHPVAASPNHLLSSYDAQYTIPNRSSAKELALDIFSDA
jgi:hypothetical protein